MSEPVWNPNINEWTDDGEVIWINVGNMHALAGSYLAHNLMLIAFQKYWKRVPSLQGYVSVLDLLIAEGLI